MGFMRFGVLVNSFVAFFGVIDLCFSGFEAFFWK